MSATSFLCVYQKEISPGEYRPVCSIPDNKTRTVVLFLLSTFLVGSGLYLYLGNIGTIAAVSGGSLLFLIGLVFFVLSTMSLRSVINQKE